MRPDLFDPQSSQPTGEPVQLNVAAVCRMTRALGPGRRIGLWVQGCTLNCPGCIAPEWIPIRPANLVDPEELAESLLEGNDVDGITISGGEPMLQAWALSKFARRARQIRESINIISFSGYRLSQLNNHPPVPGVEDYLRELDVLIDGPFISSKNDNQGLRGSSNQVIHYFTDRLKEHDFDHGSRKTEVYVSDGQIFVVGVPSKTLNKAFNLVSKQVNTLQMLKTLNSAVQPGAD